MEVETSDLIAICSLLIAFFAYRHAVKSSQSTSAQIQKISEEHLKLSSSVALTKASQKYVLLLSDINSQFELITKELAYPALLASRRIGESFDKYDKDINSYPYLSHCFHQVITLVREAYDHELTYQTGLNLTDRIRSLKFIKDDVHQYTKSSSEKSIFSFLKKERPPQTPEEKINSSTVFWDSVKEIYNRIPGDEEAKLFNETLLYLDEYRKLHESKQKQLKKLEERLEAAIKENTLEMFDIRDIPNLGQKFYRVKSDIGRYRELYFPDFHGIDTVQISDGVAYSIYAGSVVFIASQHFMWGKI